LVHGLRRFGLLQDECARMDEIWVASAWVAKQFVAAGVAQDMLHVIPEPTDASLFNPRITDKEHSLLPGSANEIFGFLSVFEWEERKVLFHRPCFRNVGSIKPPFHPPCLRLKSFLIVLHSCLHPLRPFLHLTALCLHLTPHIDSKPSSVLPN